MIQLEQRADGVVLPVRAQAGARTTALRGLQDGALKVSVTQVAEKGKANRAIAALLSKRLHLRKSQIELISGETSKRKQFLVRETTIEPLQRQIDAALSEA